MQFFTLIPLISVLICAAFVAVAISWDSERRATRSMAGIFVCVGCWGLIDLLSQLESDPARAEFWLRLSHLPVLLLGPGILRVLAQLIPSQAASLVPIADRATWLLAAVGCALPFLPGVVDSVTLMRFGGWMPEWGPVSLVVMPLAGVLPTFAALHAWKMSRELGIELERSRSRSITIVVIATMLPAFASELFFPLLQIPIPRLGALTASFLSASMWMLILHRAGDLIETPQGAARAVLAELQSGIALVESSGTILSSNPHLAGLLECRSSHLLGTQVEDWLDAPMSLIRSGLEDHEYRLRTGAGKRLPVSVSSGGVHTRNADSDLFVIVFRDLRGVDALRRRLLTSGRLAAIGELAAGIAHEVNNPVAFIRSDLNFLRERLAEIHDRLAKEGDAVQSESLLAGNAFGIDQALDGIERVAEVVGDVRGFAHVGEGGSVTNAAVLLEGALRLSRLERREEVALRFIPSDGIASVISGQDLKQIVLALLRLQTLNCAVGGAVEVSFTEDDSLLRVLLRCETLVTCAEEQVVRFNSIEESVLEAQGSDLGLAIAIELCDQLGGQIELEATAEFALDIRFSWPLVEDAPS